MKVGHSFKASLCLCKHGKLHGLTNAGRKYGYFSFDPSSSTYIKVNDFDYINGANPMAVCCRQAMENSMVWQLVEGKTLAVMAIFKYIFPLTLLSSTYTTKPMDFDNYSGSFHIPWQPYTSKRWKAPWQTSLGGLCWAARVKWCYSFPGPFLSPLHTSTAAFDNGPSIILMLKARDASVP